MKHLRVTYLQILVLLPVMLITACKSTLETPQAEGEMKLIWADEFEYTGAPDPAKWGYDLGNGCPDLCGWGNNELQYYTDKEENVRVEEGNLVIEAHKDSLEGMAYTSARVVSKNKGDFKYGRFEIRAKVPKGKGTWAAIWMLPTEWKYGAWPKSGEIDIMEFVGYVPDSIYQTVHTGAFNGMYGTQKSGQIQTDNTSEDFQVFKLDWTPEKMEFFVDERLCFTFEKNGKDTDKWPFDQAFHLIANIAVGGNWGGKHGVDANIWPQKMLIDYVRVYQKNVDTELTLK